MAQTLELAWCEKISCRSFLGSKLKTPGMGSAVIYCEGEMSTNLSSGVANADYIFRHPETDTMTFCAYA
jgi:hypothetical protein